MKLASAPGAVPVLPASGVPAQRSGVPGRPGTHRQTPDRCTCVLAHRPHRRGDCLRIAVQVTEAARDRAVIAAGGLLAAGLYPKEET
jgi:hypothetical protein